MAECTDQLPSINSAIYSYHYPSFTSTVLSDEVTSPNKFSFLHLRCMLNLSSSCIVVFFCIYCVS